MRILLFYILLVANLFSQNTNYNERYLKSYKEYENATCPIEKDDIKHFIYFARDREAIRNYAFLEHTDFEGAQIMYAWKDLEPEKDEYNFSMIYEDYNYLKSKGKKLFIQLQDATFSSGNKPVPDYLLTEEYDWGVAGQMNNNGKLRGWVAKRWNSNVQDRFAKLLVALGDAFDGKIEGINLQETAIGVSAKYDSTFSPQKYVEAIKINMLSMKKAFNKSVTMQYANFMPSERGLLHAEKKYLKIIYEYGELIGVALGAPDLLVKKKEHLNHPYAMMHEAKYTVPLGVAVQDGNYIGKTGTLEIVNERKNIVPMLHDFAKEFLKVKYMFWSNQTPYFEQDVIPCFKKAID